MPKLENIIGMSNILSTHNTVVDNTPISCCKYFYFKDTIQQHSTMNNLSLSKVYNIPNSSLKVPNYKTNEEKY